MNLTLGQESSAKTDVRDDLPFRVYANWAIETFDSDDDGSLTKEEMKDMRGALLEDRFDLNKNGKLSFDEIVSAIRRPSADQLEDKPGSEGQTNRQYERYARALINAYDTNHDKQLDKDEISVMRRPLPKTVDSNEDGNVSFNELFLALKKGKQHAVPTKLKKAKDAKPILVVKEGIDLNAETLSVRFFKASMKKNDKNNDGKLDSNEIEIAKWSSPRWQVSDTNQDGELSQEELKVRYYQMFKRLAVQQQKRMKPSLGPPNNDDAISRLAASMANDGTMLTGLVGDAMVSGQASKRKPNVRSTKKEPIEKSTPVQKKIDISLYLIKLPRNASANSMSRFVETLKNSDETVADEIQELAQKLGIKNYDQLNFSATEDEETTINSGSTVPRIAGSTETNRGTAYNIQYVDVGLKLIVVPKIDNDSITLNLNVGKSDVVKMNTEDGESPDERVVQWEYESHLLIEPDEPSVVGTSNSGHQWIMVIDANLKK
jgi:Ca2+-binding EF-hand superfamily protein